MEMSKIHGELNEKISEIRRLQMELSRRGDEDSDGVVKDLKRVIAALEKENTNLKVNTLIYMMQDAFHVMLVK